MTTHSIASSLGVSATLPGTEDAAGYGLLTFTQVNHVAVLGEYGDSHSSIDPPPDLVTGRQVHLNGTADGGTMSVTLHTHDLTDAGQDQIRTSAGGIANVAIAITDPAGNIDYFSAAVANYRRMERSTTSYEGATFELRINTALTQVEA